MSSLIQKLSKYQIYFIIILLVLISEVATVYYFLSGEILLYADAISRLNIARKVFDNITPGLPQLGNIWLPLPQILMLPFIWNKTLWQTGIAGSIMSMLAFIVGGFYVFKASKIITNSFIGSLLALTVYCLNINILYLQTTAMSEALFLATLAAAIYYFLVWIESGNKFYLLPAALSVSAMTLTRYEGLALLISSIPMVYVYSFIKTRKHAIAEANTLMYGALACLGFGLWTLYLTAIFGDPLYWKNYYAGVTVVEETGATFYSQAKPLHAALWQYFTSTAWMIGLFPLLMSLPTIIIMLIHDFRKRTFYFLPLLLPLSIFLFMALTLQRNTPIVQPDLNQANILSSETSAQTGFNIRYGLLLLPWVAIMTSYLFIARNKYVTALVSIIFISLFSIQVYSYFIPSYSVIYQIPAGIVPKPYGDFVKWMKDNYDGGYIMISAASHEDQMFEMGFNYKTYIHEGTNQYWKESLDDPPRYAKWVVLDKGHDRDAVAQKNGMEVVLDRDYDLMYDKEQVKVYKIKKKPYFEIK